VKCFYAISFDPMIGGVPKGVAEKAPHGLYMVWLGTVGGDMVLLRLWRVGDPVFVVYGLSNYVEALIVYYAALEVYGTAGGSGINAFLDTVEAVLRYGVVLGWRCEE